jgi:hypothetical protein
MWKGFKFGGGLVLAALLAWIIFAAGKEYGFCSKAIDEHGPPPAGNHCEWVAWLHNPTA